jgi:hypothetical protein
MICFSHLERHVVLQIWQQSLFQHVDHFDNLPLSTLAGTFAPARSDSQAPKLFHLLSRLSFDSLEDVACPGQFLLCPSSKLMALLICMQCYQVQPGAEWC